MRIPWNPIARPTMSAEEVEPAAASTIEAAQVVDVAIDEDIHRDEARDEDDGLPHCPSVNAEEVDTVAESA